MTPRGSVRGVLAIDTATLVERHAERIRLAGMNTGAAIFPNTPGPGPGPVPDDR